MIVLAYLLAINIPGPWSHPSPWQGWLWLDVFGLVALADALLMVAEIPIRAFNTFITYIGLMSQ